MKLFLLKQLFLISNSLTSMNNNLKFLSSNVNGLNLSKKQLKKFEYISEKIANNRNSYRKLSPLMTLSSTDVTILKMNCFLHMKPQIHAVP